MKYLPSKRVMWLVIPLMPVLLMCGGVWIAGLYEAPDISTWGSKPPPVGARSKPKVWLEDSIFSLMTSDLNPWKSKMTHDFGSNLETLKNSENPEDQAKYQKLKKFGKEWYERILARHPELAVTYRNLPEEKNGLLQWARFEKKLRDTKKPESSDIISQPYELTAHFGPSKDFPWNAEKVKSWLESNRASLDEARTIAFMQDRSSWVTSEEDGSRFVFGGAIRAFSKAFLMEARLFAEQGDAVRALESVRAARGLADHLLNGEAPTLMQGFNGAGVQQTIDKYVIRNILPALPAGQTDVAAWEVTVNPTLRQPAEFSKMIRGEWNTYMPEGMLPALADTKAAGTPGDAEALAEAYTQYSSSLVTRTESLVLSDLSSNPVIRTNFSDLSLRSQQIARNHGMTPDSHSMRNTWERYQVQTGMTQAAFAILKGQPIPSDPLYGVPYRWDAPTRTLFLPDIPEYKGYGIRPMVLPKL